MKKYYKKEIDSAIDTSLLLIKELELQSDCFFNFDKIFETNKIGKIKLEIKLFLNLKKIIEEKIYIINTSFENILMLIKKDIYTLLKEADIQGFEINDIFFDDKELLDYLSNIFLQNKKNILGQETILLELKSLLLLKNNLLNILYLVKIVDQSHLIDNIKEIDTDILIDNSTIFDFLNILALKTKELKRLKYKLSNFYSPSILRENLNSLDNIVKIRRKDVNCYKHNDVIYKINLFYENDLQKEEYFNIDILMIENIISCLIEQSCLDIIGKDLHRGNKIKNIYLEIKNNKKSIEILCRNEGKKLNITSEMSKNISQARNLTLLSNIDLSISNNEEENIYTFSLDKI